jgi:hypothetical protein
MVDESLGQEATEEPFDDALLQMELDHLVGHDAGVFKDYRTNG